MYIVTGASGQLGSRVVDHLLGHVPAEQIALSVRDPAKVEGLVGRGVRIRRGNYDDPASLRNAWAGGRHLLLISSNGAAEGRDPVAQHSTAISIAKELGVERILYTSQVSSSPTSMFPPGRDHAATEALLAESGVAWTAMRHGFYAESAIAMHGASLRSGAITAPAEGPVAWTTHDDLAAADAVLLAGKRVIDGPTPPLTAGAAWDLADLARIVSEIRGQPITRSLADLAQIEAGARANGLPEGVVEIMIGYYRAAAAGEFEAVDPTLAGLIGRTPTNMHQVLREAFN